LEFPSLFVDVGDFKASAQWVKLIIRKLTVVKRHGKVSKKFILWAV